MGHRAAPHAHRPPAGGLRPTPAHRLRSVLDPRLGGRVRSSAPEPERSVGAVDPGSEDRPRPPEALWPISRIEGDASQSIPAWVPVARPRGISRSQPRAVAILCLASGDPARDRGPRSRSAPSFRRGIAAPQSTKRTWRDPRYGPSRHANTARRAPIHPRPLARNFMSRSTKRTRRDRRSEPSGPANFGRRPGAATRNEVGFQHDGQDAWPRDPDPQDFDPRSAKEAR